MYAKVVHHQLHRSALSQRSGLLIDTAAGHYHADPLQVCVTLRSNIAGNLRDMSSVEVYACNSDTTLCQHSLYFRRLRSPTLVVHLSNPSSTVCRQLCCALFLLAAWPNTTMSAPQLLKYHLTATTRLVLTKGETGGAPSSSQAGNLRAVGAGLSCFWTRLCRWHLSPPRFFFLSQPLHSGPDVETPPPKLHRHPQPTQAALLLPKPSGK